MAPPSARPAGALGGPAPVAPDAHPLTSAADSRWSAYFENEELFRELHKDVLRTLPGVRDVVINLHHGANQILRHLRDRKPDGLTINLSFEPEILGTGGALVLVPIDLGELDEDAQTTPDGVIHLLGESVQPGTTRRLSWSSADLFEGLSTTTPVMVVNGARPGPTLCLTAAVHGDELNGIEMVRRIIHELDPAELSGAVIGVPVVNLHGFRRATRYLPDRRDLNRYFPGNPGGSSAARIAHAFFTEVVVHCNALVDLHTGSFHRTNLPQLRADLGNPQVVELTGGFGNLVVVHSRAAVGTLRRAAMDIGIPAVTMEAGEPMRLQPEEVAHGVQGIRGLLNSLQMVQNRRLFTEKPPVYYSSRWVRTDHGGMLLATVQPGDRVRQGQQLGTVTDPVTNRIVRIVAPTDGRIIGMALNQVIMPGFATFHLGLYGRAPTSSRLNGDEAELALRRPNGLQGPEPDEDYAGAEPGPEETWPSDPEYDN
jgi:predicted deacylase